MKKIVLLFCVILSINVFSQSAYISPELNNKLNQKNKPSEFFKVLIVLSEQVNLQQLKAIHDANNISLEKRQKEVIKALSETAETSQLQLLRTIDTYAKANPNSYKNLEKFWIVNAIAIDASADLIYHLSNDESISEILPYDFEKVELIKPVKESPSQAKSIGGTEPGLLAINAHKLWKMGYTGKGRISYSVDTGVWPNHPAISDRFLANFFPMSQCWYAFDSPLPSDKGSSHGTHTLGTTLGLDRTTHDTIGMAFNAYWIASDPIVTDVALIKPFPVIMLAYQFALNPDGDTATVYDIPDAINNSWGRTADGDTVYCVNSVVTQAFDAVEAVGIANIFSAGNEGPGAGTISDPHQIATNLVNSFTVGALNAHDTTFPIASFSSRGPTHCPGTGSLAIKPEVSAPGYQVRSAVDQNNYAVYNGTSMAGPHATGAVLLLKEAFPFLAGDQILLALYNSAVDLGAVGEDNTYGMGMIDVFAAYNYLAQTYTPIPATKDTFDIAITEIISPDFEITCDTVFNPIIIIKNIGDSLIQNAVIEYRLNNENIQTYNWTGILSNGQLDTVSLPQIIAQNKTAYELKFNIVTDTSITESDYFNNRRIYRFHVLPRETIPFFEYFEVYNFNERWNIQNPDNQKSWDTIQTGGIQWNNYSAYMNFAKYTPRASQKDGLISPFLKLSNPSKLTLNFKYAYYHKHQVLSDTLKVIISDNSAKSFDYIVFEKGGADLNTLDTAINDFVPKFPYHWKETSIDISQFASNNGIIVKFEGTNRQGNNLYLDNIVIFEGVTPPLFITEKAQTNISIYPNPTNDEINIEFGKTQSETSYVEIYNLLGEKLIQTKKDNTHLQTNKITQDISSFPIGIYIIRVIADDKVFTQKFIKI
ncbi:MAG: S8 family peptidase [Saprospiraceae bacterium]|nr:S8 family peptidase [Saprospiraceae bacterium]